MTSKEVAKAVMKEARLSQAEVAVRAGFKGQTNIATMLRSRNMRVDSFVRVLNACGYDLVAKSRDKHCHDFVVDGEDGQGAEENEVIAELEPDLPVTDEDMASEISAGLEEIIRKMIAQELKRGTHGRK